MVSDCLCHNWCKALFTLLSVDRPLILLSDYKDSLMKFPLSGLGALGLALFLLSPTKAQAAGDVLGEVVATIDGTPYHGETLHVLSEGTATAEFRSLGPVTMVTIQAHDPDAGGRLQRVLSLDFSLTGRDASTSVMEATLSWWPEGMRKPFYLSEDSGTEVAIALERLSLDEGDPEAAGTFSALLCRKDSLFAAIDNSDCLSVEGSFDTVLRKGD